MPRNKTYDADVVLEKAMNVFWVHGYEATSVRLLEKEMGINQFSIYASFKNKKNLFINALRAYREFVIKNRFQALLEEGAGFAELEKFLLSAATSTEGKEDKKGCLVVNTAGELGYKDPDVTSELNLYYNFIRNMILKVLKNAVKKGEIPANTDIEKQAGFFLGVMQGISVAGKTMEKHLLQDFIEVALKQIR
ncbi:transcriptional regulator, TetR family [Tangfeifania diversioriginum]|uniref:Transcriptional regulator, TetR family n=1 Tax=Tangfeifania diversioriginum TaxID=1168035 RepID=A0A1M6MRR6_9BACT|nr:TetR/AcrR family transcriptional regulator [Tangfeifania diversioriginum]SHJ86161.1 transcriptional regulator, TetR family [Tangfeifania diversioriginum]